MSKIKETLNGQWTIDPTTPRFKEPFILMGFLALTVMVIL